MPIALDPHQPRAARLAVLNRNENPCAACMMAFCDAPWSSGRTGCPACGARGL